MEDNATVDNHETFDNHEPLSIESDFEERGTDVQLAALYGALATARGGFAPITKGREVSVRMRAGGVSTFAYADMDELLRATTPALAANGLAFMSPFTRLRPWVMVQRVILAHAGGARLVFTFKSSPPDGEDLKTLGGYQTYLTRYAYRSVLVLSGGEDADDMPQEHARNEQGAQARDKAATSKPAAPAQRPPPQAPGPRVVPSNDTGIAELKSALKAKGYATRDAATTAISNALQADAPSNWLDPGVLSEAQLDVIMGALMGGAK